MKVDEINFRNIEAKDVVGAVSSVKLDPTKYGIDRDAAENLIHYFHFMLAGEHLFQNVQLSPIEHAFVDYVGHAFKRITEDGESTQVAFGLQAARGKYKRGDATERDLIAVIHVIMLMRMAWKWQDAIGEAANHWFPDGKGEKAIEAAYSKFKNGDESYLWGAPDALLISMLPSGTPHIKPLITG